MISLEGKRKLADLFRRAFSEGPQFITRRGKTAVLLSEARYNELMERKPSFKEFLLQGADGEGLEQTRDTSPMRDVDF